MKQTALLLALSASLLLGACGGDSSLPVATGKASITAVNAIYGSPALNFLIEERSLAAVPYKGTMPAASYDDLDYAFSFEVLIAGDTEVTRIASQNIDFIAGQHYTLLASGTLAAPTLTLWEIAERTFVDTETVFQARFAHTSDSMGAIDVYFGLDGVAPVLGEQVATLAFGEISAPLDFETDEYAVTITTAGDDTDILYQSSASRILERTDLIIAPFDGDENDTSPIVVRALNTGGGAATFLDPNFPSTIEFLHGSYDLGSSDVYDDEALTSQLLSDHTFRQLTPATDIADGEYEFFYTPSDDTSVVSLQSTFIATNGAHFRIIATGTGGTYSTINMGLNRRSLSTAAKLNFLSTSSNFDFLSLYIVTADGTIENTLPFQAGIVSGQANAPYQMLPGSFDVYLTQFGDTEIIAGPFRIDVALGDVLDMVVYDKLDGDTGFVDIEVLPVPGMAPPL